MRRWFKTNGVTGLAVVCGPASGDLVCRDFDTLDAYRRWADARPELADLLPTVRTARGYHVYFTGDCERIVSIDNGGVHEGELRGAGIVLLPPSEHPSGAVYKWIVQLPDGPIPAIDDAVSAGLLPASVDAAPVAAPELQPVQQREQRRQSKQKKTEKTEDIEVGCCGGLPEKKLADILQSTQPTGPGQRNRAVFELARALQGEPGLCDADPLELRTIVEAWHKRALPVIRTKPFEETWIDFLQGWSKVKYPKGAGPMDVIFERSRASSPPAVAMRFEQQGVRQLVSLCRELQRQTGDRPFFLGCRTAGRLLDVAHTTAYRWLFLLKSERVLQEVEKGKQAGNKFRASRYRYVADDDTGTAQGN
jgi:hypothetical protein